MGKHGPCCHCGVTSTPLWRNGPPGKPVLCNACGSRWRTKGTLANYTPLHSRAELDDFEDYRVFRAKNMSSKNKEPKLVKLKQNHDAKEVRIPIDYNKGLLKGLDEDSSNRSGSGSTISNSESYAQFGSTEASDLPGPTQSHVWDGMVPSRKRTGLNRPKQSSVEKLTQDLYTILHEEQSSYFSGSSEEDLLFESDKPMVSVEIGHGSVLIRHPNSIGREEESEASSLSVTNKQQHGNEAHSQLTIRPVKINKGVYLSNLCTERPMKSTSQEIEQTIIKRDKDHLEKLQILGHHKSPLCHVDLKDVLNYEEFVRHFSSDEQKQLLKYLAPVDSYAPPDSLKSMFESSQFEESLSSFQRLLAEGVFDNSLSRVKLEDTRTLKKLILCHLTESKWVEKYNLLKDTTCKSSTRSSEVAGGANTVGTGGSVNMKRPLEGHHSDYKGEKRAMKSPKTVFMKRSYEPKELIDPDISCFSPKCLIALPCNSSHALDSVHFANESSDHDLLLDVPSSSSFPQAELLLPVSSVAAQASTDSSCL